MLKYMSKTIAKRSLKVSLLVGTFLTVINQHHAILNGDWSVFLFGQILLTYMVPFCVATYGSISTRALIAKENTDLEKS